MIVNDSVLVPKSSNIFCCKLCDYNSCRKSQYSRHLLTDKHKKRENDSKMVVNDSDFSPESSKKLFTCDCGKVYKYDSGYYRHKKNCNYVEDDIVDGSNNLIMELLKQNNDFKELLVEQNKNMMEIAGKIGNNTNCHNTNTKTNNFNLQLFLNEKCKDALNIDDFVNQIQLQVSDLDMMGQLGYTEGMSKIIIRNLKELDVFKRPIHCSDLKRETMYVKDKDTWEKENGENVKIKKVIKCIEHKNIKQIPQWVEENPASEDTETKRHMEYKNIVLEAMGGSTSEDDNKKREKIIRNIAKEVTIDKTNTNTNV
jgi:hypothetical protein